MSKAKSMIAVGKRKTAVARAHSQPGTGKIFINSIPLALIEPETAKLLISEPVILAGETANKLDIRVNVQGGGVMGQAQAARQAIARIFAEKSKGLRKIFIDYDRTLLVADVRRNEPHKPGTSKRGPRRHKQRSKR